jgi:endo-1,4-beta-D-glucanase Y
MCAEVSTMMRRSAGGAAFVIVIMTVSGCFNDLDLDKLKCSSKGCPSGYTCMNPGPNGHCVRATDGGLQADAMPAGADGGGVGKRDSGSDSSAIDNAGSGLVDAPSGDVPFVEQGEAGPKDTGSSVDTGAVDAWLRLDTIPTSDVPIATGGSDGGDAGTDAALDVSITDASGAGGTGGAGGMGGTSGTGGSTGSGGVTGAGGTVSTGGATATGGVPASGGLPGTGGVGTGGVPGTGGTTVSCPTSPDTISDFEDTPGKATMDPNGGRTGYWYVYFPGSETKTSPPSGTTQAPPLVNGGPVDASALPAAEATTCNQYALHATGTGFTGSINNYAGIGAFFSPHAYPDLLNDAYDTSVYTGITFKLKSGSGTLPPTFFEVLTKENQPTTTGGSLSPSSTGPDMAIGLYNTRGWMINRPWVSQDPTTSWQTYTIPFGQLIPRHLCDTKSCGTSTTVCQPPGFNSQDVLGIQFSFYAGDKGWPTGIGTPGTFDIWIDDLAFVRDDSGIQTIPGFPLAFPGTMGSCSLPSGPSAKAKYLVPAYNQWKATFVSNGKVIRPEHQNDTTSEAIAAGMLIAVNMNDKTLFDTLFATWTSNTIDGTLMTWCLAGTGGGTGNACSPTSRSATGADEDAAFALLQAAKVFGDTSYKTAALNMIAAIATSDIDFGASNSGTKLPKGGSSFGSPAIDVTSPAYFAPAYYTAFKAAGDTHDWDGVTSAVYTVLNTATTGLAGTNNDGLFAAWCKTSCTAIGTNTDPTIDVLYQYDSHHLPMRIGQDYCFNGRNVAQGYLAKVANFFANSAYAGKNGTSRIFDIYDPATSNVPMSSTNASPSNNAASAIGSAAVAAMYSGTNQSFVNAAYQATFDLVTRGSLDTTDTSAGAKTPYTYANATVGLLSLLTMTGNFSH